MGPGEPVDSGGRLTTVIGFNFLNSSFHSSSSRILSLNIGLSVPRGMLDAVRTLDNVLRIAARRACDPGWCG